MNRQFITDELTLQNWFFDNDVTKCAFDTESRSEDNSKKGALDYSLLYWIGVSFCNGKSTCYVDLDVPDRDKMIAFLEYQFRTQIKKLIAQNIQYDMMVLYKYGIQHTEDIYCTMVAAHLIDERGPKGLKDLTARYLSPRKIVKWKDVEGIDYHSEQFYDYGADDAQNAWELHEVFYPKMAREKLTYLMFKIEMPFQFCLRDLHINGILIDQKKLQEIEDLVEPLMLESEDKMLEMIGKKAFIDRAFWEDLDTRKVFVNFNSNKQVIPLLMEKFSIEFTELTVTGEKRKREKLEVGDSYWKLDKIILGGTELDNGVIGGLAQKYPFCRELLIYRMAFDIKGKFTVKMKESLSPDGRIRCSFNDTVAATGRLSSSDPNLQNLRKLNAVLDVECRSCFIAPEGKSFIVADYAGQELRILAFVTQDPTLLRAFEKGMDLHLITANLLFDLGLTEEEMVESNENYKNTRKKFKNERHKAKNGFNFPVVYGSTEHGISRNIGVSVKEAKRLLDKFLDQYPGIKDGIADCEERIKLYGYVTNSAGRRRRFDGFSKRALRQAFNFKVQGYSAEMLRLGMVNIRQVILTHPEWDMKLVLTVHDEVVLEIKDEYIDEAIPLVEEAMCTAVDIGIPVECDIGVGRIYSEAK
ncbi:hypothetical protein LCGC14_1583710 [marine sediment metagenome]|uniref:DNA-directed DNA polymerase family A palm domain-containing protein n=1 Tax=marine sediment metagenome TaxID=412755 RepID=A0A0F9LGD9_9ZZZZ